MKGIAILTLCTAVLLFFGIFQKGREFYTSEKNTVVPETPRAKQILFVGDIMLGRHVETLARDADNGLRSFGSVSSFLKEHVTIANLEGPIPKEHVQTRNNGFSFSFSSSTPRVLKEGGIAAVSLANNHMFDKGHKGWMDTRRALEAEGVAHFGGYSPTEDDYFETKLGTTTVIVYGMTMIATGWDEAQALSVTEKLRREHEGAYLVAFIHWGNEYVTQNAYQREFAHKLIDRGVDAIVGAHPHIVQGVEIYKEKPIFYSLGNFIFDQYWRNDLEDGYMLRLGRLGSLDEYELIPVRSYRSVPSVATSSDRARILSSIASQSDSDLREEISKGFLRLP